MNNNPALRALTELVHHTRAVNHPDQEWDRPGVLAALIAATEKPAPLEDVAYAAIRAAKSSKCQTPGVIPLDGEHWRPVAGNGNGERPRSEVPKWDADAFNRAVAERCTDWAEHAYAVRAAIQQRKVDE